MVGDEVTLSSLRCLFHTALFFDPRHFFGQA
jgi:hypothetical protein